MVVEVSKKYLPDMAVGFSDPRVQLHIMDGNEFMKMNQNEFDVIIVDSSDPVGPASVLFERAFYEAMHAALRPGGIVCTQAECMWLHKDLISGMLEFSRQLYTTGSVSP